MYDTDVTGMALHKPGDRSNATTLSLPAEPLNAYSKMTTHAAYSMHTNAANDVNRSLFKSATQRHPSTAMCEAVTSRCAVGLRTFDEGQREQRQERHKQHHGQASKESDARKPRSKH